MIQSLDDELGEAYLPQGRKSEAAFQFARAAAEPRSDDSFLASALKNLVQDRRRPAANRRPSTFGGCNMGATQAGRFV